jgi:thiol-disulfide isomerase/thioredoxin
MKKLNIVIIALILFASIGFGFRYFFQGGQSSNKATEALFAATFPDEKGQPQALSQYKGKTIVLNFWATWCEPCREEMPELSSLHEESKNKNGEKETKKERNKKRQKWRDREKRKKDREMQYTEKEMERGRVR